MNVTELNNGKYRLVERCLGGFNRKFFIIQKKRWLGWQDYSETFATEKAADEWLQKSLRPKYSKVLKNYGETMIKGSITEQCEQHQRQMNEMMKVVEAAVLAEREACAKVCEDDMGWLDNGGGELCAAAIRARGEKWNNVQKNGFWLVKAK